MLNKDKERTESKKLKKERDVLRKEKRRLNKELSTLKLIISEINSTLNLRFIDAL